MEFFEKNNRPTLDPETHFFSFRFNLTEDGKVLISFLAEGEDKYTPLYAFGDKQELILGINKFILDKKKMIGMIRSDG